MLFLVVMLAVLAGRQLLLPGYFESHDGIIHAMRLAHFYEALKDGKLIIRWFDSWMAGYGSPLFIFNWSLPYYIASLFHFVGFSLASSLKLVFFSAFLLSGVFSFLFLREATENKWAAFAGAISYIWAPYLFTDVYVRGALGEVFSFSFFPLIFWLIYRAFKQNAPLPFFISIIWSALIITHNIMALLGVLLGIIYILYLRLIYKESIKAFEGAFLFLFIGIGLTAFFWLPAILEKNFNAISNLGSIYRTLDQFPSLKSLIYSKWQYAYATPTKQEYSMSFMFGIIHLLVSLIAISISLINLRKIRKQGFANQIFFAGLFVISLIFTIRFSAPVYKYFQLSSLINFPWRFLELLTFASSFLIASFINYFRKYSIFAALITAILIVLVNWPYSKIISWKVYIPDADYLSMIKTNINYLPDVEYLPKGAKYLKLLEEKGPANGKPLFETDDTKTIIYDLGDKKREANIVNEEMTDISANIFYFPGWTAYDNNNKTEIKPDSYGLISFRLNPGKHLVKLNFEETLVRKIADFISLGTLGFLIFLLIFKRGFYEFK